MILVVWTRPTVDGYQTIRTGIDTGHRHKGPVWEDPHIEMCMYRRLLWIGRWS